MQANKFITCHYLHIRISWVLLGIQAWSSTGFAMQESQVYFCSNKNWWKFVLCTESMKLRRWLDNCHLTHVHMYSISIQSISSFWNFEITYLTTHSCVTRCQCFLYHQMYWAKSSRYLKLYLLYKTVDLNPILKKNSPFLSTLPLPISEIWHSSKLNFDGVNSTQILFWYKIPCSWLKDFLSRTERPTDKLDYS